MRRGIELALLAGAVVLSGCATKKYVGQQVDPVQQKLNQVQQQQEATQKQLDTAETKISAAQEKADAADSKANEAAGQASALNKKTDQLSSDLSSTRNEFNDKIANLDNYKSVGDVTVLFQFNSAKLSDEAKQKLNEAVQGHVQNTQRYFVSVEGFTDKIGDPEYNLNLSRRRAIAVQNYLITQYNLPAYRVQIVGLGEEKPVNSQKTRQERSENRRVQVTVYAPAGSIQGSQGPGGSR
jgi:outer membrane protein OmpA-like peptidoglycan-associated protein